MSYCIDLVRETRTFLARFQAESRPLHHHLREQKRIANVAALKVVSGETRCHAF